MFVVDDTENENLELSPPFSSSLKEGKGGEELKGTVQRADLITLIFIWGWGGLTASRGSQGQVSHISGSKSMLMGCNESPRSVTLAQAACVTRRHPRGQ